MAAAYRKGSKQKVSDHFYSTDFDCKCTNSYCKDTVIDEDLLEALDELWDICGEFKINSAFRCIEHNTEVGGSKNSRHLMGQAADCKSMKGYNGNLMARYGERVKAFEQGGIGIYPTFAHLDVRKGRARWADPLPC